MREKETFSISRNEQIARDTYEMHLEGDCSRITRPGQFVQVAVDGFFLRRPISVCDAVDGRLTLIYKTVGRGTEAMAACKPGGALDLLTGLGNGFDVGMGGDLPLLIGGGVGLPPLYWLAKTLVLTGRRPTVVMGFNSCEEIFYLDAFQAICPVILATADGSCGVRGFVTHAIAQEMPDYDYYYACGPLPMLRAVYDACPTDGQMSFEERMGCGFGACMGCSCHTTAGAKRLCVEGPVLNKEEILWEG